MARILPSIKCINAPRYDGPYKLVCKFGEWTYELCHVETGGIIVRNHHHLKPCTEKVCENASRTSRLVTKNSVRSKRHVCPPDRFGFPRRVKCSIIDVTSDK